MPRISNYGNYLYISTSPDSNVPTYESFEGVVQESGKDLLKGEGELGIRASWNKHYVRLEIFDRNEGSMVRVFGSELELEGNAIDLVNLLGGRFQSFFVKTSPNSVTEVKKEGEKVVVKVSKK